MKYESTQSKGRPTRRVAAAVTWAALLGGAVSGCAEPLDSICSADLTTETILLDGYNPSMVDPEGGITSLSLSDAYRDNKVISIQLHSSEAPVPTIEVLPVAKQPASVQVRSGGLILQVVLEDNRVRTSCSGPLYQAAE